jgi:hypothetical protein
MIKSFHRFQQLSRKVPIHAFLNIVRGQVAGLSTQVAVQQQNQTSARTFRTQDCWHSLSLSPRSRLIATASMSLVSGLTVASMDLVYGYANG